MTTLPPTTRELARLRPAEVAVRPVRNHRAPRRPGPAAAPDRHVQTLIGTHAELDRELRMMARRRGELLGHGERHLIQSGPHAGLIELRVVLRGRPAAPRWVRVCTVAAGALVALAVLGALVAWVLASLDFLSLAVLGAVLVAVLAYLVRKVRRPGVTVQVTTTVHVR